MVSYAGHWTQTPIEQITHKKIFALWRPTLLEYRFAQIGIVGEGDGVSMAASFIVSCKCNLQRVLFVIYFIQGGVHVLQLMDTYAASWSVFLLAILECLAISYVYGE